MQEYWWLGSKIYNEYENISPLSNRNREGSNVQHLNAEFVDDEDDDLLTMKLVPKVLESTHNYSAQLYVIYGLAVPTLSIMYEILRGWKTPELFDTK